MKRRPPRSPLFPSTTLFRSHHGPAHQQHLQARRRDPVFQGRRPRRQEIGRAHVCTPVTVPPRFLSSNFLNETATTEISSLSLHDALPISPWSGASTTPSSAPTRSSVPRASAPATRDRKSTRLHSSHSSTSFSLF